MKCVVLVGDRLLMVGLVVKDVSCKQSVCVRF